MLQAIIHLFENKAQTDEKIRRCVIIFVTIVALLPSLFLLVQMHMPGASYKLSYRDLKHGSAMFRTPQDIEYTHLSVEEAMLIVEQFGVHTKGAFCTATDTLPTDKSKYPLGLDSPDIHVPWVWDAVESVGGKFVYVIIVDQFHCKFDHSAWKNFTDLNLGDHSDFYITYCILYLVVYRGLLLFLILRIDYA
jgi:hypothetical protein